MTGSDDSAQLRYPHVVAPLRLGHLTLRNRIARPPHGTGLADRIVSDDLIRFHQRRAQGGVGLVVLGDGIVHSSASGVLQLWEPAVVPGMRALADAVHDAGAAVIQQLNHQGAAAIGVSRPWSASAIPLALTGRPPVPMTEAMIADVVDGFVAASRNCRDAGLDGVEVHGGHGFLVGQFLSPLTNERIDGYGGSATGRARFLVEILTAIRERVPGPFLLGVRCSVSENLMGGLEVDDTIELAVRLEAEGLVDFVDLSTGHLTSYPTIIGGMHEEHGYQLAASAKVTAALSVPTIVTGRVHTLAEAEEALAADLADIIGMARPTIADPDLVIKSLSGRELDVIPCIACNECISTRGRLDRSLVCTTNPAVGGGPELDHLAPAASPRRVLVIGGGPAGLEAARVAAVRGHDVVLYEARDVLGGAAQVASLAPYRADVGALVSWLARQVDQLGVDVHLGHRVVSDDIAGVAPDVIVLATGGRARTDGFQVAQPGHRPEGITAGHVVGPTDVLVDPGRRAATAVVVDDRGTYDAVAVAEVLACRGTAVTIVTRFAEVGSELGPVLERDPAQRRLSERGVVVHAHALLEEVHEGTVTIGSLIGRPSHEVPAELVVMVGLPVPCNDLADELGQSWELHVIGDAADPRDLRSAMRDGHLLARRL